MRTSEELLLLEGADDRFVIGARFWGDVVAWAMEHGWVSDIGSESGRINPCRRYSDEESRRLADALEIIGGNLILESRVNVSDEFIAELANALLTLQRFAESGGFRVTPRPPSGKSHFGSPAGS